MHSWSHEHHSSSFETTCTVFPGDSPVSCRISKEKGSAFICYHQFTRWDNSLSIRFCLPGWIVLVGKLLNYLIFTVPCWEWYCSNKSMIKTKYQVNTWIFQRAAHLLWHCIPLCKTFLYPTLNKIEVNHSNSQGTIILLLPRKKFKYLGVFAKAANSTTFFANRSSQSSFQLLFTSALMQSSHLHLDGPV